jgi:hypothetical protein
VRSLGASASLCVNPRAGLVHMGAPSPAYLLLEWLAQELKELWISYAVRMRFLRRRSDNLRRSLSLSGE